jgi:hypothetical protein
VITATFDGYLVYGLSGAIVATAAIFLPSFLILVGIAPYFDGFAPPYGLPEPSTVFPVLLSGFFSRSPHALPLTSTGTCPAWRLQAGLLPL